MRLFGREAECAILGELVADAGRGRSAVLVLRGEAGVGKTSLLRFAERLSPGALGVGGVEAEAGFPYAALHRLLIPLLPLRGALPAGQRAALEVACGLSDGEPADLHLVSLAALTLLARESRLCVVDDAQWLDSESLRALAFVGRRLHAEGVVLLLGWRDEGVAPPAGLPVLELGGLPVEAAVALLAENAGGPLDPGLAAEIARATGGNPLALTDLARELTAGQLRGTSPLPGPVPIGSRLEAHYSALVRGYSEATRTWLLVAATGAGEPGERVAAAAMSLGVSAVDAEPAESDGLVTGAPPVAFRHPLMRSAVYGDAPPPLRRAVHAALAVAADGPDEVDRRAWHLAAAAPGPDEAVAAALERSADRAGARGGHAARADFLARAAELTDDPVAHAVRRTGAAEAALAAGAPARAMRLLDGIVPPVRGAPSARMGARWLGVALMVRANAAASAGVLHANRSASAVCLEAAEAFGEAWPEQARAAVLSAIEHEIAVEDLTEGTTAARIAAVARRQAGDSAAGVLMAAYAAVIEGDLVSAAPALRRAVAAMTDPGLPERELLRHIVVAVSVSTLLWDDRQRQLILDRATTAAHRAGALQALDLVCFMAAMSDATMGRLNDADRHEAAGLRLRRAIGITAEREQVWSHPELAVWRIGPNDPVPVRPEAFEGLGLGAMRSLTAHGLAIRDIACGDYATATGRLLPLVELGRPGRYARVLPDLVESALRTGDRRTARLAYDDLRRAAEASGTDWAIGLTYRCGALLATDEAADSLYRRAIERLGGSLALGDQARAHLLYGEWLRRRRRRREARERLGAASAMFESVRAVAFTHRAERELNALGGGVRNVVQEERVTGLTSQEAAVARLARNGGTNAEIAAHLFLSANTVDYHLRKIYRKLGVSSRRQLRETLHD
ncbi:AAA family ATPase [Actinoplanes sp. CA-054009]